jgi:nitric-oxide synthase, bacterial
MSDSAVTAPPPPVRSVLSEARAFLEQFHAETEAPSPLLEDRWARVMREIEATGSWTHTREELTFGARVAWRNSVRCIGRLPWASLHVLDCRSVTEPREVFHALREHLAFATNGGRIRSVISIFSPPDPHTGHEIRILNGKLTRYAGYATEGGVVGDPDEVSFTRQCEGLGWKGSGGRFDLLPVVIERRSGWGAAPEHFLFEWDAGDVLEVPLEHPEYPWFEALGLRWIAVPVIANHVLEIGGVRYLAAPFNGHYMGTEIGARNLGDEGRYNLLPVIAERMGLDRADRAQLWKDRALVELNTAVLHSYRKAGVTIVDHHTASEQFLRFAAREEEAGRPVHAEWSWIVPPMSGSATGVFHRAWPRDEVCPNFFPPSRGCPVSEQA